VGDHVAPDGSPVAVYLALPAGNTPEIIDSALRPHSSILELGSGPGRITHPLLNLGHEVVAVDDSVEMLAHVHGAETVRANLFTIDLGRRFDAVVAGSHLINSPDRALRLQLLGVCRRHVRATGVVLIERYPPEWAASPQPSRNRAGQVHIAFEPLHADDRHFRGRVTYELGDRQWIQEFDWANLDEDALRSEAEEAGLRLAGWLDESQTWARLVTSAPSTVMRSRM
jgi:SAM-dependent methyltransferase